MTNPRTPLPALVAGTLAALGLVAGLAAPAAAEPARSGPQVAVFDGGARRWTPAIAPTVADRDARAVPAPAAAPTAAAAAAPAAPDQAAGQGATIVRTALAQVGTPYRRNGRSPGGFDCSGLVHYAYKAAGITVPHQSGLLARAGRRLPVSEARPGDILWRPGHVGIYIGNGKMVHATYPGAPVRVDGVAKMRTAVRP